MQTSLPSPATQRPPLYWHSGYAPARSMQAISVFVVDDHSIFRRGLAVLLAGDPALTWAGEADSAEEALRVLPRLAREGAPDVVLFDMVMPGMDGAAALALLRQQLPHTRFIAVSCNADVRLARAALDAGVHGYMLKTTTPGDLALAIHAAHAGRRTVAPEITAALDANQHELAPGEDLTQRERKLLELMAQGLSNQEIGQRLAIRVPTVKFHVTNILSKLQVENRTSAVLLALRHRIVVLEG